MRHRNGQAPLAAWAAVAILYLVHTALAAVRLKHELKGAIPVRDLADRLPAGKPVDVLRTDAIPVPLTFGLLRPKVYVPEAWDTWSAMCRRMVLAHELAHIRRWDRLGQAQTASLSRSEAES